MANSSIARPKPRRNAKALQTKSRSHTVTQAGPDSFTVTSGNSGNSYTVTLHPVSGATCSCDWAKYRPASDPRSGCSHVVSVFNHIAEENGRKVSAWASPDDARRQHKPTVEIGDGLTLTARLDTRSILWSIGAETRVLEVAA